MKKKVCSWLDSNIRGGIQILDDNILPCCSCGLDEAFFSEKDLDYSKISIEELKAKRKELFDKINCGTACRGCEQIVEKEESDINIGKIHYLSIGLFSTCNLRCRYCYFTHDELGKKLTEDRNHLLPFVKKLYEHDFLKNDVGIGIAGGEPTLFEDLGDTLKFLSEKCTESSLILLSNSSISNRTGKFINDVKDIKMHKSLYTSVDAGTAETYKFVRGKDLYMALQKNLINYAKNNIFDNITLKYILMFDNSNTSDKDIFGFLTLFNKIMSYQKGKMSMTIDCDMLSSESFDGEIVKAAGKMFYVATEIFGVEVAFCGGGITHNTAKGRERIKKLQEYASKYKYSKKSLSERFALTKLTLFANFLHIIKTPKFFPKLFNLIKILYFQ